MKTIIAGATGLVGNELLQLLLKDNDVKNVIALVRKPLAITDSKLKQEIVNFDELNFHAEIFNDVDTVFCCLGTTIRKAGSQEAFRKVDFDYPLELAKIAEQKNAKQFLCITSLGADTDSKIFYSRLKGELEQEVNKLKIPSISFFRPSFLDGNRKEKRAGERIAISLAKAISFLLIGSLKKYRVIHAGKVAAAMLMQAKKNIKGVQIILSDKM